MRTNCAGRSTTEKKRAPTEKMGATDPENGRFKEIADAIHRCRKCAVLGHMRPDGDAIGSQIAFGQVLRGMGKDVSVINEHGVPANLKFLPLSGDVLLPGDVESAGPFDTVIALDTARETRLGEEVLPALKKSSPGAIWINIDHHVSNSGYGDIALVDGNAPATGQIIFELIEFLGVSIPPEARDNLYVAIVTDTGSFRYPGTTSRTHEIAAKLIEMGADVGALSEKIYDSYPLRRLILLKDLLPQLELGAHDRVASVALDMATKTRLALQPSDTEGLIDILRAVETVHVAIFLEELEDGRVRVSMRAREGKADVNKICARFDGGGHPLAAGARLAGPFAEAKKRVLNTVYELLETR